MAFFQLSCPVPPTTTTSTTTTTTTTAVSRTVTVYGKKDTTTSVARYVWYSINGGSYTRVLNSGSPVAVTNTGQIVGTVLVPNGGTLTVAVSDASTGPTQFNVSGLDFADSAQIATNSYNLTTSCANFVSFTSITTDRTISVYSTGNVC